jgi:hypothetical protein
MFLGTLIVLLNAYPYLCTEASEAADTCGADPMLPVPDLTLARLSSLDKMCGNAIIPLQATLICPVDEIFHYTILT